MNRHRLAEARSLALHRAIGELLDEDPSIPARARARVRQWLVTGVRERVLGREMGCDPFPLQSRD
ncbi:MAG TPA: hypothetical protein VLK65_11835 [Vicinamibacteria bacterium]|nr:hypothetical protein [Vicinamibacteria bacterium]